MRFLAVVAALCIMLAGGLPVLASGGGDSTADKVRLQAAMQRHIDSLSVDGAVLHLDMASGEVIELFPTQAHPMIMTMGDHFVLCAELKDAAGRSLPIDLYVAVADGRFVTFRTEIGNRSPLQEMMKRGQVRRLK